MVPSSKAVGRYEILGEIGRGAMGIVYKARDPNLDRIVALKTVSMLDLDPADEREYRERFQQEARMAGRLSHPGIVAIFDVGSDPETMVPYIVMEYIAGSSLDELVQEDGRFPLIPGLQIVKEVAEALDYAHREGITHRDVKPANILVTSEGRAKLADFGIARLDQSHLTLPGRLMGSPAYMSPEQMREEKVDGRSDLFSLGVVLYRLITGHRPFQGNTTATVCYKLLNQVPLPPSALNPEIPPELDDFLAQAMAKDPADRFQTGNEMSLAIQSLRDSIVSGPDPLEGLRRLIDRTGMSLHKEPSVAASKSGAKVPRVEKSALARPTLAKPALAKPALPAVAPPRPVGPAIPPSWIKAAPWAALVIFVLAGVLWFSHKPTTPSNPPIAKQEVPAEVKAVATDLPAGKSDDAASNAQPGKVVSIFPQVAKSKTHRAVAAPAPPSAPQKDHALIASNHSPTPRTANSAHLAPDQPIVVHNVDPAQLAVVIEHGFEDGTASVTVDQKPAFTQELSGETKRRGLIFHRTQGRQSGSITLPPGKHDILVRVNSPTNGYDISKTLSAGFTAGSHSTLLIKCDKRKNKLDAAVEQLSGAEKKAGN